MPLNEYQFVECCKLTNFFLFSHHTPWSPLQSPPKPTPSGRHHLEIGQRQCEKNCRLNFNHQMDGNRRLGTITYKSVNYSIAVYKQKGNVKHSVAKRKRETRRSTQRCTQQMNLVVSGIGSDLWPGEWPKKNLCVVAQPTATNIYSCIASEQTTPRKGLTSWRTFESLCTSHWEVVMCEASQAHTIWPFKIRAAAITAMSQASSSPGILAGAIASQVPVVIWALGALATEVRLGGLCKITTHGSSLL